MVDVHNKKQRSYNMSQIKCRNTKPEIALRKILFKNGIRGYRINYNLQGKPDIVFPRYKIAIFIDGCFWHKCPDCFKKPETNKTFWEQKIQSNVERDRIVNSELERSDWKILRFWEHEIRKDINNCYQRIKEYIENTKRSKDDNKSS